jgi:murein L,D-transpeptidase YcbB/YkuD
MSFRILYAGLATVAVGLFVAAGCRDKKYSPQSVERVFNVDSAALHAAIAARIGSEERPAWVKPAQWQRVRMAYQRFGNSPLWLEPDGVQDRANAVLDAIRQAPEHALDTAAYPISEIERVVDSKRLTDTATAATLAAADVLLTSAYVAYAADMLSGQVDPKTVSQAWFVPGSPQELDSAIVRGIEGGDMKASLAAMAPQDPAYAQLKEAYARYRRIAASGGWRVVASSGDVAAARARVATEFGSENVQTSAGEVVDSVPSDGARATAASPTPTPDPEFAPLLRQFQERYTLEPTGRLNRATIDAMNVSAAERAQQIGANLERHRWLPRYLGSRYIYVNVPSFRLEAYDSSRKVLEMKVVVGEEYEGKTTPVFSDSMEVVVFRPYWNVTPQIQREEIEPKVASDPGYLARNNMEYWSDKGVRRIRQKPGEKNSLGLVKFLFPNNYNIYLHDTPAKSLFQKADRAASHGCIRVEKPAELAEWVLGWPADKVEAMMQGQRNNQGVRLPHKIPVYIVYFTTYVHDGQLYFSNDIYGRDEKLKEAVAGDSATADEGSPADSVQRR